jgi:hypothetical protein
MNATDSLLDAQTVALLRRVAREQDSRVRLIRDESASQSAEIVRKARTEARARVHQAVVEARREDERALARRRAALDTQSRQARQTILRDWLEQAWQALPAALESRWLDPGARERWCVAALQAAQRDLLHRERLQVEVAPRWATAVEPIVQRHFVDDANVEVVTVEELGEGLRIRAGNACVDATVTGLLAPRERIAADLLAEFMRRAATRQLPEDAA